ncbi:MAG: hypothetical protein RMI91_07225 [Gemmatales bacterium]|nr:hypothetical protein [Gemmatales bacterium]MDW7994430.1 hypothetical protein [Gemmatales bacterium]
MSAPSWIEAFVRTADLPNSAEMSEELTHVEVGEVVLSGYVVGPNEKETKRVVEGCWQRLVEMLKQTRGFMRPERGSYESPCLTWLDWHLQSPGTVLGWCGAFHIILCAETLEQGIGCLWKVDQYKAFARQWTELVQQAFRVPSDTRGVILDERPFFWTLALDTTPSVEWTQENMHKFQRSLVTLVRARSRDASWYTEKAMREILESNLALTTQELQLMSTNTGLIYVAKQRFQEREGFSYVRRALVDALALVRAMRACMMLFGSDLDSKLQQWMQRRVKGGMGRSLLHQLVRHAQSASEILRQFDELNLKMTRQIGHEQIIFQALLERYRMGQLVQNLHQNLSELHYMIGDLHGQIQTRQLRWLQLLVIFPAAYQALKLFQEVWPTLQPWLDNLLQSWPW